MSPVFISAYASKSFAGDDGEVIARRIAHEPDRFLPGHNGTFFSWAESGYFEAGTGEGETRFWGVIESVAKAALQSAGFDRKTLERTALFTGSTSVHLALDEDRVAQSQEEIMFATPGCAWATRTLGERLGLGGPKLGVSLACASSAGALVEAAAAIRGGWCEAAVVVGYEVRNRLTLKGFEALGLLSPRGVEPFGRDRLGMMLGEGCGALVLSRQPSRWCFRGGTTGVDPYGVTAHEPDGMRMERLIARGAKTAGIGADRVTLVKAHATGSENNDLAEGNALWRFFGGDIPPVTALKPYIGHTLGACGALETALLLACLDRGFAPGLPKVVPFDEATRCRALENCLPWSGGVVMSTYLGFGGSQAVLFLEGAA